MKKIVHLMILSTLLATGFAQLSIAGEDDGGDIIYEKPVMGVIFSHDYHVEEMGFDCESCHDDIFEMESLIAQEDPAFTMQGLEEGLYCGACHDGSTAFASNTRCASCHIGVKGYNRANGITADAHGH